jgi:quinol monooxygenase YgiN
MPLDVFVRFQCKAGREEQLKLALLSILTPTRAEPHCLDISLFASRSKPCIFFIHSVWEDEAGFEAHAKLPHMVAFLSAVGEWIEHGVDATRTERIG